MAPMKANIKDDFPLRGLVTCGCCDGSRDPKHGQIPNHIMIRKFLKNAREHLSPNGKFLITAVDTSYYDGIFRIEDAARFAGYKITGTRSGNYQRVPTRPRYIGTY